MSIIMKGLAEIAGLTDQVIATDFYLYLKSGIRNYAIAISEVTSADLRAVLKQQLYDALNTFEAVSDYMTRNGYVHPYDLLEQYNEDLKTSDTALTLAEAKRK
jgi:similar to spore coat protein